MGAFVFLLDCTLKATILFALAGAGLLVFRKASAAMRHMLLVMTLVATLLLPVFSMLLPGWQVLPAWRPETLTSNALAETAAVFPAHAAPAVPAAAPPDTPEFHAPLPAAVEPKPAVAAAHSKPLAMPPLTIVLPWIYDAGLILTATPLLLASVLLLALRLFTPEAPGSVRAHLDGLARGLGLTHKIRLLQSPRRPMPMTWGGWTRLFPACILLPRDASGWGSERLRCVLLHELAHIQRRDCQTLLIARMACCMYWFHPLAWVALARLRAESELACDDLVLCTGTKSSTYAQELLTLVHENPAGRFFSSRLPAVAAIAMARPGSKPSALHTRLRAILDSARPRRRLSRITVFLGLLAALCLLIPLAVAQRANADASLPTFQEVQALLRQPADAPALKALIDHLHLAPDEQDGLSGFSNPTSPIRVLLVNGRVERITLVINRQPAKPAAATFSNPLPAGVRTTDSPEDIIKKLGEPDRRIGRETLYYATRALRFNFEPASHLLLELNVDAAPAIQTSTSEDGQAMTTRPMSGPIIRHEKGLIQTPNGTITWTGPAKLLRAEDGRPVGFIFNGNVSLTSEGQTWKAERMAVKFIDDAAATGPATWPAPDQIINRATLASASPESITEAFQAMQGPTTKPATDHEASIATRPAEGSFLFNIAPTATPRYFVQAGPDIVMSIQTKLDPAFNVVVAAEDVDGVLHLPEPGTGRARLGPGMGFSMSSASAESRVSGFTFRNLPIDRVRMFRVASIRGKVPPSPFPSAAPDTNMLTIDTHTLLFSKGNVKRFDFDLSPQLDLNMDSAGKPVDFLASGGGTAHARTDNLHESTLENAVVSFVYPNDLRISFDDSRTTALPRPDYSTPQRAAVTLWRSQRYANWPVRRDGMVASDSTLREGAARYEAMAAEQELEAVALEKFGRHKDRISDSYIYQPTLDVIIAAFESDRATVTYDGNSATVSAEVTLPPELRDAGQPFSRVMSVTLTRMDGKWKTIEGPPPGAPEQVDRNIASLKKRRDLFRSVAEAIRTGQLATFEQATAALENGFAEMRGGPAAAAPASVPTTRPFSSPGSGVPYDGSAPGAGLSMVPGHRFQVRLIVPREETTTRFDEMADPSDPSKKIRLAHEMVFDESALASAKAFMSADNMPQVEFTLGPKASKAFEQFTGDHLHQQLAMIVDGKILSMPTIQAPITGGRGWISLGQSAGLADAEKLAATLNTLAQGSQAAASQPATRPAAIVTDTLEGIQIHLKPNDSVWNLRTVDFHPAPGTELYSQASPTLKLDVSNRGSKTTYQPAYHELFVLELDGKTYEIPGELDITIGSFKPGESLTNIPFPLADNWGPNFPKPLAPGKHTVRVLLKRGDRQIASNPVTFEINRIDPYPPGAEVPPRFQVRQVFVPTGELVQTPVDRYPDPADPTRVIEVTLPVLLGDNSIASAKASSTPEGTPQVEVSLTDAAAKQFAEATKEHVNQRIAIIVDNKVISTPHLMSPITGGKFVIALGNGATAADAEALVGALKSLIKLPAATGPASSPGDRSPLEGMPISAIDIEGNQRVPREDILRQVTVRVSDRYEQKGVNASIRGIAALDVFSSVRGEVEPVEQPDHKITAVIVRFRVEEKKSLAIPPSASRPALEAAVHQDASSVESSTSRRRFDGPVDVVSNSPLYGDSEESRRIGAAVRASLNASATQPAATASSTQPASR